jgi:hypothetical protein
MRSILDNDAPVAVGLFPLFEIKTAFDGL